MKKDVKTFLLHVLESIERIEEYTEGVSREEQPDMIAFRRTDNGWRKTAIEVEVRADHPEQVLRNYEKNVKKGYGCHLCRS